MKRKTVQPHKISYYPSGLSFAPRTTLAATEAWWDAQMTRKRRREGERPTFMGVFPLPAFIPPAPSSLLLHSPHLSLSWIPPPLPSLPYLQCMRVGEEGGWGRGEKGEGEWGHPQSLITWWWGFRGTDQYAHTRFYSRFSIKHVAKFVINGADISLQMGKWIWIFCQYFSRSSDCNFRPKY